MRPPLAISDLLVVVASSACGLWLTRGMIGASAASNATPTPLTITLLTALPCVAGGLIVGHPAIVALHFATRRRATRLSACEALGTVPLATFSLVWFAFFCDALIRDSSWGAVVVGSFISSCVANVVAGVIAVVLLLDRYGGPKPLHWTDWSGAAAVAFMGGAILLLLMIALSYQ